MKHNRLFALLSCICALGANSPAEASASPTPLGQAAGTWQLTFDDEFSGNAVDRAKWHTALPSAFDYGGRAGWGGELEYYLDSDAREEGGVLHLVPEQASYTATDKKIFHYESGAINSQGHFSQTYGYFEIRAKIPHGRGLWPALWLLNTGRFHDPHKSLGSKEEIDILENLGHDPHTIYMTLHFKDKGQAQGLAKDTDYSQDYHTYAIDWEPDHISWYIDGKEKFTTREHIPQTPMYVIINLAIGGHWPGNPDSSTPFERNDFLIDYVRVYKKSER